MKLEEYERASVSSCLLIVSGPDRAGKGWLGERLHKRLMSDYLVLQKPMHLFDDDNDGERDPNWHVLHGRWLKDWYKEIVHLAETYKSQREEFGWDRVVVDRLYADEWVYSRVFGRQTYTEDEYRELDSLFLTVGAKQLIVVEPDLAKVRERLRKSAEKIRFRDYEKLWAEFMNFEVWTSLPTKVVNTRRRGIVEEVAQWAFS